MTRHLTAIILLVAAAVAPAQTTQPTPRLSAALQHVEAAAQQDVAARAAEVQAAADAKAAEAKAAADKALADQRAYAIQEYAVIAERLAAANREVERLRAATQPTTQPAPTTAPTTRPDPWNYAVLSKLGANVDDNKGDWIADQFKMCGPPAPLGRVNEWRKAGAPKDFGQGTFADHLTLPVDADGHPLADFSVKPFDARPNRVGEYRVLIQGTADVTAEAGARVAGNSHDPASNVSTITVVATQLAGKPAGYASCILHFRNTGGKVRLLEMKRRDNVGFVTTTESRAYVKAIGFGTLRWMQAQRANDALRNSTWDQRSKPIHANWYLRGVPYEVAAQACNEYGTHGWFHVPVSADDDHVRRAAQLIDATLSPSLKAILERANESWNEGFEQLNAYWYELARADGYTQATHGSDYTGHRHYLPVKRAAQDAAIVRAAVTRPGRASVVLNAQATFFARNRSIITRWERENGNKPLGSTGLKLGVAPYNPTMGVARAFDGPVSAARINELLIGYATAPWPLGDYELLAAFAREHGLPILVYECGIEFSMPPGWPGGSPAGTDYNQVNKLAAQKSPAIAQYVDAYVAKVMTTYNPDAVCWHVAANTWGRGGDYGLADETLDPTGPKAQAYRAAAAKYPGN